MSLENAYTTLTKKLTIEVGKFFSANPKLSVGAGTIYGNVRYPLLDTDQNIFDTVSGLVYVLTHECDVAQDNVRIFNSDLLICPIIPLEDFVAEYEEKLPHEQLIAFVVSLASRDVSRVIYIPTIPDALPYGGLLYLNQISSTNLSVFKLEDVKHVSAVTAYGLTIIDQAIQNHLLRPKAERLALAQL